MLSSEEIQILRSGLLSWYAEYKRDLPWRRTSDPYSVWVSEVMLQQTRVAAVIPFYQRFLARFPTFSALANAPEPDLLAHWAGLGYYYRARNMQKAAREMAAAGGFPQTYEGILALPGIGEYTAAAVGSISFGLPHPVVDGNVYRVLSRVFADETNIASSRARRHFTGLADQLLPPDNPGTFNQASMELGATVCLPKNPQCLVCPIAAVCRARAHGRQADLPVKTKPRTTVDVIRTLYWIEQNDRLLLWQRPPESRLMAGFWELPESEHLAGAKRTGDEIARFRHGITHHNYHFVVVRGECLDVQRCQWISTKLPNELPFSTVLRKALRAVAAASPGR